tara:strand:- start:335 stop:637 length:303 start_codon:yes stop_codon:yes gene_type:complete
MTKITIHRPSGFSNRLRKIQLVLDDQVLGSLKNGESQTYSIPSGAHRLKAVIDWCESNEVTFDLQDGETKTWTLTGSNPLFAMWYITVGRKQYLKLSASE